MRPYQLSVLLMLTLAVACTGCGQSEYDSRMDNFASVMAKRAADQQKSQGELLAANHTPVQDLNQVSQGLSFKAPKVFTEQTTSIGPDQQRAKLLQADIVGFCYTMERPLADDAGKTVPAYCYLFSVPKAEADNLHTQIQGAVAAVNPSATWTEVPPVKSPTGDVTTKTLQAAGDMQFEVNGVAETLPGQLEIYSFDAGANQVAIGFRAATANATKHKFFEAVKASMASVQFEPAAAAAAAANPEPAPAPAPGP